jgi:hypothetical protein
VEPTIHVTAQIAPPVLERVTVKPSMDWDD